MRIVLDTNVVLAALLWQGTPHHLLAALRQQHGAQLYTSTALLEELADVLSRPFAAKRLAAIDKTARDVLADYVDAVELVEPPPLPAPVCRDPDDDEVLALALASRADLIVSGDNDLLVLQHFEAIPIVNAATALQQLAPSG